MTEKTSSLEAEKPSSSNTDTGLILGADDQSSQASPISTQTQAVLVNESDNPWPHIKDYFTFIGKKTNGKNVEFQCVQCKPPVKKFSTSIASSNNLKKHLKSAHPFALSKFQNVLMMQDKPEKEHIHNHMMVTIKQPQNSETNQITFNLDLRPPESYLKSSMKKK